MRLRLIGAPARIVSGLAAQLEPVLEPADGADPDIVIRFEELSLPRELAYVGRGLAAFGDGRFFVLDDVGGRAMAQLPVETVGGRCEMVCSTSVGAVPLLFDLIVAACWSKGLAPMHASALVNDGVGMLVMGWPKGGKTGAMLSFIDHGAEFVGDEWIVVDPSTRVAYGLPLPVGVSEWQWQQLPHLVPRRTAQQRLLFGLIHSADRLSSALDRTRYRSSAIPKALRKGTPALRRQLKVSKSPGVLFPGRVGAMRTTVERSFLVLDVARPTVAVERCDAKVLADRMVHANLYEMRRLLDLQRAHAFAFPDRPNDLLSDAVERMRPPVSEALAGTETFVVRHPYGGPLEELFRAMAPWTGSERT